MATTVTTTYSYLSQATYFWNLNEMGVPPLSANNLTSNPTTQNPGFFTNAPYTGSFRKQVDWGGQDMRNRSGVYLISDPRNTCKLQFFTSQRSTGPATTGSIIYTEPIVEYVDTNNHNRRQFFISPNQALYCEPTIYNGFSGPAGPVQTLYIYQLVPRAIQYFVL